MALARALAPRPSILLLDEPFAAVDPATRHNLRRELRAIHTHERVTTLQVTHDFDEALRLGDVVAVMAEGRIAQLGRPDEVLRRATHPARRHCAPGMQSAIPPAGRAPRLSGRNAPDVPGS